RSSTTQYLDILKEKLSDVDMDVVAEIGTIDLSIRDVLALRVGDVVRLSTVRVGDPLTLSVGNKKKFYCQPGVVGKKMAVQVIGKIDENESEDFEELSVEGDESYD
ncbi:MAG: FliM/FliN family flagellar motor switch protein, partial [Treponema sp.]|nr:FliM/FliN family flagellar motor switch protein [Treponema sp.]